MVYLTFSFQDVVLQWLMSDDIQLNQIDAEDPEVRENTCLDTGITNIAP